MDRLCLYAVLSVDEPPKPLLFRRSLCWQGEWRDDFRRSIDVNVCVDVCLLYSGPCAGRVPVLAGTSEGIVYNCRLTLPLPHQAVVFGIGKWEQRTLGKSLTVELTLDEGDTWQKLGTLTDKHRSLCWQGEWRDDYLRRSIDVNVCVDVCLLYSGPCAGRVPVLAGSLCWQGEWRDDFRRSIDVNVCVDMCLLYSGPCAGRVSCGGSGTCGSPEGRQLVSSHHLPDTPIDTPDVPGKENLLKSTGITEIQNEYTPPWDVEDATLSETSAQEPTPKRRRTSAKSRTLKEQLKSSPADRKKTPTASRSKKGSKKAEMDTEDSDMPSARWGHSLCPLDDHRALLIGGMGKGRQLSKDSIWQLDTVTQKWEVQSTSFSGPNPETRMGHTATYDPVVKCVYVFGGSKNKRWFSDVHVLDVQTWQWSSIEATGDAPTRSYHSSTLYRHELFVFGGVFPNPDPEPDGCSNEVFVYSPGYRRCPHTATGDAPTRSYHSSTLYRHELFVFGDMSCLCSEVCSLTLTLTLNSNILSCCTCSDRLQEMPPHGPTTAPPCTDMSCLCSEATGDAPTRSYHSSTLYRHELFVFGGDAPTRSYHSSTLYRHELFVFGGVFPNPNPDPDGCSNEVFVYSSATESWYKPLVMGDSPTPRSGHSAVLLGERLVVFGGWDAPVCYNDVSILDLCLMDWTQPEVTGKPPAPRSWHTAVPLSSNSFLVHGGYDGDEVMGDSFIFSLDTCSWSALADTVPISPCCGHQGLALPRTVQDKENQEDYNRQVILIFGGGDNNGHFFNQLHRHTVSHDACGTAVGDTWCW
uniref:Uncharacterized protein n=1 Tax=Branchiostoma floridae TaxID=7739 RepID=C3ZQJ2_BRAFL|eukprot:XP_002589237.1 hypothetical protein BRAFLDRAFT_120761 [Branchiostoma floridae]